MLLLLSSGVVLHLFDPKGFQHFHWKVALNDKVVAVVYATYALLVVSFLWTMTAHIVFSIQHGKVWQMSTNPHLIPIWAINTRWRSWGKYFNISPPLNQSWHVEMVVDGWWPLLMKSLIQWTGRQGVCEGYHLVRPAGHHIDYRCMNLHSR